MKRSTATRKIVLVEDEKAEGTPQLPAYGALTSVSVGRVLEMSPETGPRVDFPGNTSGALVPARSTVPLAQLAVGQEVVLAFEEGDASRPIVLGALQQAAPETPCACPQQKSVTVDDEVLTLTAHKEIVLRCGRSSITLTSAGKVLLRGEYLLSRSSGVNRIKGGSVQIN